MNNAVPDSIVHGYEHLIGTVILPDPHDRHVVAAAIHARADAIVTFNLKDFPKDVHKSLNIEAVHPDDFLTYQIDLSEAAVVQSASAVCRRLRRPLRTGREYLDALLVQGLPKTVAALRPFERIICPAAVAVTSET